jgi:Rod binding domain-containing protein
MNIDSNYIKLKTDLSKTQIKAEEVENLGKKDLKRREVAEEFASLFTQMLLKELRNSLHEDENPLYGGFTEEVFKDMLYEEYSKQLTKNGLKPLVDLIYSSTLRMDQKNL